MRLIDRYIGGAVVSHTLVVMAVLMVIYFFTTVVAEMGDYNWGDVLLYSLMLMPRQAYELAPLIALIGTMLGLGALANRSELTVIRAAGVSVGRISRSVMRVGALMIIVIALIGELVAPELERRAINFRLAALDSNISIQESGGVWAKNENRFVSVKTLFRTGLARGVTRYTFDEQRRLVEVITAKRGQYRDGEWRLEAVELTRLSPRRIESEQLESLVWESDMTPAVLKVATVKPESMGIIDLIAYVDYLQENGLESRRYELSLWSRGILPLATAGMILLAIPFVFGSLRSVTVGHRVMVGSLIGITFYLANAVFSRLGGVYDLSPVLSAVTPTVIIFMLWWALLRRVF